MVREVMTRVCRGHTGRPWTADCLAILMYVLVSLAALTRVSAALLPSYLMRLLEVSAAFWIAAFLLFGAWAAPIVLRPRSRSEEHTSELQSLMRISYAVFCLKKNNYQMYNKS